MGSSEEDLSRMRTFCFSLLPIFLLPFTSCSGQHIATSRDGRQFLLEANANANANAKAKANPKPKPSSTTPPIFRKDRIHFETDSEEDSLPSCHRRRHGSPCAMGENFKYAGRCCAGQCTRMRTWIRRGCPKPVKDERHRLVAVNA